MSLITTLEAPPDNFLCEGYTNTDPEVWVLAIGFI